MARTKITPGQVNLSKTVDANGWTVYDFGTFKQYRKRSTFSQTIGGAVVLSHSSTSLPVGVSTIGTHNLQYSYTTTGNAYDLSMVFEGNSASSTLNFTVRTISGGATAYTGFIDAQLTST